MRKLTAILLTVILALVTTVIFSEAASTVYYYLPYMHTNASGVTYCIVSNLSSETLNTTFTVGSNTTGVTTGTANNLSTIAANTTKQMTFYQQTVSFGSTTVTIASDAADTSTSYAGTLTFTSTAEFATTGTKASCLSVVMACFQGTTTPRRNLIGYACKDNGTDGPGGNNNVIGY
ncbi:hypothetical protein [Candidatus Magnetomonas plexicatena]|uniref:hypothetical protein n=1 Tax=Candidatus Magnetomonas plexicatena TaxID=2552947 RepID=UPI00110489B0|nr:hypothetical protein E2O03_007915 [Nitrospirales bacterium LBB_01]